MSQTDRHGHDAVRRVAPRHGPVAVIIALTAASTFGAIDQYLGALHLPFSPFLTQVSGGVSASWPLVAFLAGAWQASQRRAVLVGLAATWLSVLAYVVMIISPMEGTHLGPRPPGLIGSWNQLTPHLLLVTMASQWPWFAGGLITGPLFGWLGYRWHSRRSRAAALLAVLPVLLEPAARWLETRLGLPSIWLRLDWPSDRQGVFAEFAEFAVGLVLTVGVVTAIGRTRATRKA